MKRYNKKFNENKESLYKIEFNNHTGTIIIQNRFNPRHDNVELVKEDLIKIIDIYKKHKIASLNDLG